MRNKAALSVLIVIILCVFSGCSQQNGISETSKGLPRELQQLAVRTAETIAPKDTETPAEEGGYGFENLAEGLGYKTSKFSDEKYFGDPRAVKGGVLIETIGRYPVTMRSEGKDSSFAENITMKSLFYEALLKLHPVTYEYIPSLATHWKISDDKMLFHFRINPDARWSDGKPVTTEDVVATFDLLMDETILSPLDQIIYGKFERPVAETKYILSIRSKELNWRNFLYFGVVTAILPAHHIKNLTGTEYLKKYQAKILPGTGPYTLFEKDMRNQNSYTLTRRLDYWAADDPTNRYRYNFDKIKFIVVRDNASLEREKFKKGETDYFTVNQARVWVQDTDSYKSVEKGWIKKRKIYSQKPAGTAAYAFNMREPPFNDKRIRYAFFYLLNRKKLIKELFFNEYIIQNSYYAGSIYENPDNEHVEYNPEKAVQLLAEAGWKERNSQGLLINDKGDVFQLEIGIPKSIDYVVTPFQQMLRDYGIDLQIKFVDGNALFKMQMERKFKIMFINKGGLTFPNPESSFSSRLADQPNNNNIFGFKNERVDEILTLYDQEFEQAKRVKLIRELDGIVMEVRPLIYTHYAPFTRLLFWDKFGYPDYMLDRFVGDYDSIYELWWFDPEKVRRLEKARKTGDTLPQGEVEVRYWLDYKEKMDKTQLKDNN